MRAGPHLRMCLLSVFMRRIHDGRGRGQGGWGRRVCHSERDPWLELAHGVFQAVDDVRREVHPLGSGEGYHLGAHTLQEFAHRWLLRRHDPERPRVIRRDTLGKQSANR